MIPYAPFDVAFGEDVTIDGLPGRAIIHLRTPIMDGDLGYTAVTAEVDADSDVMVGSIIVLTERERADCCTPTCYTATRRIDDSDCGWKRFILAED